MDELCAEITNPVLAEILDCAPGDGDAWVAPEPSPHAGASVFDGVGDATGLGDLAGLSGTASAGLGSLSGNASVSASSGSDSYGVDAMRSLTDVVTDGFDGERDSAVEQVLRTLLVTPAVPVTAVGGYMLDAIRSPFPGLELWDK